MVTTENLKIRKKENIDIISRLPGRFGIEDELKKKATAANEWEHIGKLSEEKGAASYKVWNTMDKIEKIPYRFIVVHSDHLDKRKLKSVHKSIAREFDLQSKDLETLSKRRFACMEDAWIEVSKHKSSHPATYHEIICDVQKKIEKLKRIKRGRPRKDEVPELQNSYYVTGNITVRDDVVRAESDRCQRRIKNPQKWRVRIPHP